MNIFAEFQSRLLTILHTLQKEKILPPEVDFSRVTIEPPRDAAHGDMATNAAMVLAKPAGVKPRELAEKISAALDADADVMQTEIAGAGFVNITLTQSFWHNQIAPVLKAGTDYGSSKMGQGEKVNIEYVSANPTGPMHVGHARGAVVGDALARLLERVGYKVTREYYVNDAGVQMDILAQSALLRMREVLGENIGTIPEGLYPGDYVQPIGQALAKKYGTALPDESSVVQMEKAKAVALPIIMETIRNDLAALGIKHDEFISENTLHEAGAVKKALQNLEEKGLIYEGVLEPPKGKAPPPDWEPQEQTLFKATQFGDDSDRALKKSDGSWTYFAADIAYHFNKYERGFTKLINVWGADHAGYIKRMESAVKAITDDKAELDVKICQMVKLMRGGKPVKMSKRAGDFITLREVVDEVGKNATRFMMLTRKNDAPLDFDFVTVKEKSRDNPVFYVQYAHARICSVLRNAVQDGVVTQDEISDTALAKIALEDITHPAELALIRWLAVFPRIVEQAAQTHEPHRIAFYLGDVAAAFHSLWNLGKENSDLKFILAEQKNATLARIAMIRAVALVIASGLDILGVQPEEEMR